MTGKEIKKVRAWYRNRYHLDRAYVNRWLSVKNVINNTFDGVKPQKGLEVNLITSKKDCERIARGEIL